jgi:hypothetical protein
MEQIFSTFIIIFNMHKLFKDLNFLVLKNHKKFKNN